MRSTYAWQEQRLKQNLPCECQGIYPRLLWTLHHILARCKPCQGLGAGKTAIQDILLRLDPDLARHRAGRTIMQKLEDTYGDAGAASELNSMPSHHLLPAVQNEKNQSMGTEALQGFEWTSSVEKSAHCQYVASLAVELK